MRNEQIEPSQMQKKPPFFTRLLQSQNMIWIQENPKKILYLIACIISLFIVMLCFLWKGKEKHIQDYELATALAIKLKSGAPLFEESKNAEAPQPKTSSEQTLNDLIAVVKKNPSLAKEFAGLIAQEMIFTETVQDIAPYAHVAIETLQSCDGYAQFSENSMLIAQQKYRDAYDKALLLKQNLDAQFSQYDTSKSYSTTPRYGLYCFNLLQIAHLANLLDKQEEKQTAVNELKAFMEMQATKPGTVFDKECINRVYSCLQEGLLTLPDFLQNSNVVTSPN
jgi:hypothetical protein